MHTIEQNIDGYRDDNRNGINDQLEVGGGGYTRKNYRDYSHVVGWFRLPYSSSQEVTKQKEGKSTMEPKNVNGDLYSGLITEARPEVFWSGGKRTSKIQYIVIHGTATTSVTGAYSTWLRSRNNMTSAHYLVTPNATMGCVGENHVAWHSGGEHAITNENSIGIEHINSHIGNVNDPNTYLFDDATLERGAKLVAEICLRYGLKPDASVIVPHRQASATACPQTLDMADYIKRVQRYYNEMSGVVISKKENTTQKPAISKTETTGSFKVRVSVTDLNIRKEPSIKAKTNGKVKPGVYTITETKSADGYEWGKLKSGAGWIALKYAKRI
ncbi:peptidoglycan recognition protein family protein [Streptococcus sp. 10F2]